ncbi:hypothetical protein SERLA73DRAFT_171084 [Serpula lacrymans var. lacrymans S7.3]|uniref:DNA-(apurinic or apyrimidinic site) endonuclease n=2 Tax=Serpula lacrymans var. lacrymans TaxID=341189 RepID=F8Q9T4_SERL3|nr:uncharacterized protein SERLADRAFT_477369 [Serpula lacrymans var. lacrymans S7.9]EGN95339.1 hypothetical protein SERLA73DRAFT_171084 [Serpula lacrymans var. lacrymans S7.3]EGO20871.1 hypothetical protein SERLADRAFT_477369 [Serpula lacrymans var. lacrymans S7.9]
MRILSWNINGIRTLPQYHPWNSYKSCQAILEQLQADIICFQEMKITRSAIERDVAVPDTYASFFSFPINKGGYSGVGVYADARTAVPLKGEEGLSGKIQPKPQLSADEQISKSYPCSHEMKLLPDELGNTPSDLSVLDAEGRAIVLDFGLFVLINTYCPNETSDARLPFKMNYHYMLQERVRGLMEEGREVLVVGDINICATPLDHCDGNLASNASYFHEHPARAWFHSWLDPTGHMIDIVRRFWPDRKGMYTCWNTKISARETNYGTRVDYILVTHGLVPWVKHGDIQPSLKGSDHCPIYIDLHDSITLDSGVKLHLRDVMQMNGEKREPPRIAAKYWEEFSGKQTLLSTFFSKKGGALPSGASPSPAELTPVVTGPSVTLPAEVSTTLQVTPVRLPNTSGASSTSSSQPPYSSKQTSAPSPSQKRKLLTEPRESMRKASKKVKKGQTSLSTFFSQPSASQTLPHTPSVSRMEDVLVILHADTNPDGYIASDYRMALELSNSQEKIVSQSCASATSSSSHNKTAWSQLLAPVQPPKCLVHGEPAKEFTVHKPGPNKGKNFFICSRPVGPGYDKGKAERLREEVDHQYRCNFFKWSSEVKKESLKQKDRSSVKSDEPT